jgi:hypothetical protein
VKGDDMDQMEYDPDEDDGWNDQPRLVLSFETCQLCGWRGMAGDEWTCPKCQTTWEAITFVVPKQDMDDFTAKAADALTGYFQRIRPAPPGGNLDGEPRA